MTEQNTTKEILLRMINYLAVIYNDLLYETLFLSYEIFKEVLV